VLNSGFESDVHEGNALAQTDATNGSVDDAQLARLFSAEWKKHNHMDWNDSVTSAMWVRVKHLNFITK